MNDSDNPLLLDPLTDRELEILSLIADGLSNPEIADRLVIGLETVRWYSKQIYTKMGVHSRTQASMRARDLGLLTGQATGGFQIQAAPRNNLPTYSTAFIGREYEMSELNTLLGNPNVRLITLVGPGGIGKTRLGVELARGQLDKFSHGAYFVSLLSMRSASDLELAIANGINLRLSEEDQPRTQLLRHLENQQVLLVLDSFEHVLDGAELIAVILAHAPGVKLIVTSHMSLNLSNEWVRNIDGLTVPSKDDLAQAETYSAVKLFEDCVHRVRGDFMLEDHLPAVIHICRMVEGVPLAMELAATWLKTLSVEDVAKEIQNNIDFLATKQRDVEERHRSIQAIFEYSWNFLTDNEQRIFRRLSVFRGGFGRAAAEQVAGADIHTLSELVGKSMLQQHDTGLYEIHGLLREYAERKLENLDISMLSTRSSKLQAWAALMKGKFNRVAQLAEMSLKATTDQGSSTEKAFALGALGTLAGIEEDYERCQQLCEAGQFLINKDVITSTIAYLGLSIARCGMDDYGGAKHYIRSALKEAVALRIPAFSILCFPVVGLILADEGKPEEAVELLSLAFTHPDSTLEFLKRWPLIAQAENDLAAELGKPAYAAAWERGKSLNAEKVADALLAEF